MPRDFPRRWLWLAGCALSVAFALWLRAGPGPTARPARSTAEPVQPEPAPKPRARRPRAAPAPAPPAQSVSATCAPRAALRCLTGDVYWVDACGSPEEKHEECGSRLCREGACEPAQPEACAQLPLQGRCDGQVARGCVGGRPYARDCAALGKRCVTTQEGAECRAPSPDDCEHHGELPRCEDDVLLSCRDGRLQREDCGRWGARCGLLPEAERPTCHIVERLDHAPDEQGPCGPCGCPRAAAPSDEVCDGEDNDDDGQIDEDVRCEPIPLVAFLVSDATGATSHSEADIETELAQVNAVLGSGHPALGLRAELADVVRLPRPHWLELDDQDFAQALNDPQVIAARDDFYLPVLFTDQVVSGDAPKAGMATLPNGLCAGRRVSAGLEPATGAIALAKGRSSTTLVHELGHFLGLCHTHFAYGQAVVRALRWPVTDTQDALLECTPPCLLDGDGICDTPPDPGPEACSYDPSCRVQCPHGEQPDPYNVMSYYTSCRGALTEQQALVLRRGLALRQGFFRCRRPELCPCDPLAPSCPEQMSCQPTVDGFGCGLEGPLRPGEPCVAHSQCGAGSLCANGTCRLPCSAGPLPSDCRCSRDPGLGIALCT